MRSWFVKNAKTVVMTSAALSLVMHTVVITGWVFGTMPQPGLPTSSIANKVFYIPPPDRVPGQAGSRERVTYIKADLNGLGTGEGTREMGNERPTSTDETIGHEIKATADSVTADSIPQVDSKDSVYSVLEVDTAVVRSATSAAPAYPSKLLAAHVQGLRQRAIRRRYDRAGGYHDLRRHGSDESRVHRRREGRAAIHALPAGKDRPDESAPARAAAVQLQDHRRYLACGSEKEKTVEILKRGLRPKVRSAAGRAIT